MFKELVLVLGVVVIAWWVFSGLTPKVLGPVSAQQAVNFVLDDLKPFPVETRVLSTEKQGDEWVVDVLLAYNAHSSCPVLKKRSYRLLPIRYREEVLIKDCLPKNVLAYPEEALITSASVVSLAKAQGAYGCAFYLGRTDDSYACSKLDSNAMQEFSSGLPTDAWVVFWTAGDAQSFLAFDRYANVLKKS